MEEDYHEPGDISSNSNISRGENTDADENSLDLYNLHLHLFPYGKFGFQIKPQIPFSPTKRFNQRLLNYTHKFSSDSDYIFFAHKVT